MSDELARSGRSVAALAPIRPDRATLVERTHSRLVEALLQGTFAAGKRMPSEPRLAEMLGVSRGTVREALGILLQQGLIFRRVGDGTYSADGPHMFVERLDVFESIDRVAAAQGITLRPTDLAFSTEVADQAVAAVLQLRGSRRVHKITRTLAADFGPLVHMVDVVPASLIGIDVIRRDFTGVIRPKLVASVRDLSYAESEIFTRSADPPMAAILEIPLGSTYIVVEETVYTRDAKPVAYSINHYNSRRVRFRLTQWHHERRL